MAGKIILVTGASSGIGLAISRRLARSGERIVAAARRDDRLAELRHEFPDLVRPVTLDVRDEDAVAAAIAGLPPDFSAIDVLVSNAGLGRGGEPVQDGRSENWNEMIDTNIRGFLNVLHAVLPGMVQRDRGHIVSMGSIAATYAYPGSNVYGGTKAFVRCLTQNLRTDLIGHQIRVTDIEPGAVDTEFSFVRFGGDEKLARSVYEGYRPLSGEDIAEIVEFVISVPRHVNINVVEVMPTDQVAAGFVFGAVSDEA